MNQIILDKYKSAKKFLKLQSKIKNEYQDSYIYLYNLLHNIGEPKFILNAKPRSLTCLIIGAIVGQKINFNKAKQIRHKLYNKLGTIFAISDIKNINDMEWSEMGLEEFQINTIKNLIKMHEEHKINLENISEIHLLLKVKGIGNWTIDNIKIMYNIHNYHDVPNIILLNDYIVKKALKKIYNINHVTINFIKNLYKIWDEHVGIIHWYIWHYGKNIIN